MSPLETVNGAPLTQEQRHYLDGFFNGLRASGVTFADVAPAPAREPEPAAPLIFEERVKKEEHPLDSFYRIAENAVANKAPDREDTFRFKWNGLFFLTPIKDAFMARLRIPGGQLRTFQLREIAKIAQELTTGYVQITTRANIQIRLIQPKDAPEILRRIQGIGLHTRGAGADNIRNLTATPTSGFDPDELIDVLPFVHEISQFILAHREFYDLPRKFNIAFDSGGMVDTAEDTNDIGLKAVRHGDHVVFRVKLGGATGHKTFARDLGVVVKPEQLVKTTLALVRVFIRHGNRGDRKKARLKHLLEKMPLAEFLAEAEKLLGFQLERAPEIPPERVRGQHNHVGILRQKAPGLYCIGVAVPVGQITPKQMLRLADLADHYGQGEVRLTVWQNLLLPHVPEAFVETVKKDLVRMGLGWKQSNLSSGLVACTGNRYCKFAATDTKGHALELIRRLEGRIELDTPVNIHLTGCPHSCAQHYMGDIGLLGAKTAAGEEAYHIFVGGGFGERQAVGRQLFHAIPERDLADLVEKMLRAFMANRVNGESFQQFTMRQEIGALQALFSQ